MSQIITQYYTTDYGELILASYNDKLCLCDWRYRKMRTAIDARIQRGLQADYTIGNTPIIEQTIAELNEYFVGSRKVFTIPLLCVGTAFQQSVWQYLQALEWGKTESYLNLAKRMKNEKAIRAIASANGANAISIIIPCHRIIGSKGELVGYAGGLRAKEQLLKLEKSAKNAQISLFE